MNGKNGAFIAILTILLAIPVAGFGQVVENPVKPKAANAGRVVVPEEVLAISDEGTSDYYFDMPRQLRIAPDGSLFLLDVGQVLQFDKTGKFLHNLFKKGQGPGEMAFVSACLTTDKNFVVLSASPGRLIFFDYAGKYKTEIPVRLSGMGNRKKTLLFEGGTFYLQTADFPSVKGDPDYIDVPNNILALSTVTGDIRELSSFSTRSFVVTASDGREEGLFEICVFVSVPFKGRYLALTHTSEYLLKIYDPAADKVIKEFRRAYERVGPDEKTGRLTIGGKRYGPSKQRFENDVRNILTRGDEIWAVTSTKDISNGVLIDVFDGEGIYRDCFYLKLPEAALYSILYPDHCTLDGDFLWIVERAEDDTCTIKKYRVGK